jgi:hypothetical protein
MAKTAVIACGALALHIRQIARRDGLDLDVYPLPPELHNRPMKIAPAVEELVQELEGRYERVVVGYAECGTRGALDALCAAHGLERLPGQTCYDIFGGEAEIAAAVDAEPGTFFLTDFLVKAFDHVVWRAFGLDRYPELRDDIFGHYRRVIWLAQDRTPKLEAAARAAADRLGLELEIRDVGDTGLASRLRDLTSTPLERGNP